MSKISKADILSQDTFAAQQLQVLLNELPYLPFSTSALRYSSIAAVLNDIVINNRRTVVEFGCGISTMIIAQLARRNRMDNLRIVSFDENAEWIKIVQSQINVQELGEYVQLVSAPLIHCDLAKNGLKWYDQEEIDKQLNGIEVDLVLVDGPSAWKPEIELSRYPALPQMNHYLSKNSIVFLDDIERDGEAKVIEFWKQEFDFNYQVINHTLGAFSKGECFNIMPF